MWLLLQLPLFMSIRQRKVEKNVLDVRIAALVVPKKTMDIAAAVSIIHSTYALDCGFSEGKAAIFFTKQP
ncbi:hypothetical protein [Butyricicoccus pullicaecorum]|uniref:hypothetical protein n=1 Tax=Butyricicoccus pullicaecorum TaxID=501571 RepID=UPI00194F7523|nr:hypothetical protein [Butyricicoccus pullicaecorum]